MVPEATYLDSIIAAHRERVAADRRDLDELKSAAREAALGIRPFAGALTGSGSGFGDGCGAGSGSGSGLKVIAEVKRRSPSKGSFGVSIDPAMLATEYEAGGAACISVLTDEQFFGGSAADLADARSACSLPVLRKDFLLSPACICDARLMGADAVLLIVAALRDEELSELTELAAWLGMDALVEVHDDEELGRALDARAKIVGVNQRDLRTFGVDTTRAERLRASIPAGVVAVAESGIRGAEDAKRLAECGFDAALVGEAIMCSADRPALVRAMSGLPVRAGLRGGALQGRRHPSSTGAL